MTHHLLLRPQWLHLLEAALAADEAPFAAQAAQAYLAHHPHDLAVRRLLGQALLAQGKVAEALEVLEALCRADPEALAAQRLRLQALIRLEREPEAAHAAACVQVLSPAEPSLPVAPAPWGEPLRRAYRLLAEDPTQAEPPLLEALPADPPTPLLAVTHLHWAYRTDQWPTLLQLARAYEQRWPEALAARLYLAHALSLAGQEAQALPQLHALVGLDPAAQVVRRALGAEHPYLRLWPQGLRAPLDLPLPAAVAARLGWNQLPASAPLPPQEAQGTGEGAPPPAPEPPSPAGEGEAGAPTSEEGPAGSSAPPRPAEPPEEAAPPSPSPAAGEDKPTPPTSPPVQASPPKPSFLEHLALRLRRPDLAHADGRFPVYVVLTSRRGLEAQYGAETAQALLHLAQDLVHAIAQRPHWDARLLVADDPKGCAALGVKPADPHHPWALKRQLAALDRQLAPKGEMIGALFILGGPEVIPFHHLPNPVLDDDPYVPSDNPYGARDENFYAPQWPVGRLPGGADEDPTLMLAYLRRAIAYHQGLVRGTAWYRRVWRRLMWRFTCRRSSRGYAAAVWASAARHVFGPIGATKWLATSPPHDARRLPAWKGQPHLAYFNLHGLVDAPAWYGQRVTAQGGQGPDYPVALRPEDIPHRLRPPRIALSEACYGAHLDGRTTADAIALKMLETGTMGYVGSTVTAYGAATPPLGGADLLAWHFWQAVRQGLPLGEALRRAKYAFAREMHRRHGFLDGADLKTLLSFVLYGDPLIQEQHLVARPKGVLRPRGSLRVRAMADTPLDEAHQALSPKVIRRVRQVAAAYLPGAEDAEALVGIESPLAPKAPQEQTAPRRGHRRVVVLRKSIPVGGVTHTHYVRVVLGPRGRVEKVVLSR